MTDSGTGTLDVRDALQAGSHLNGYRIESVLGRGGFGIVYRARHEPLDSLVAIKEYLPADLARREGDSVGPRSPNGANYYNSGLQRFVDEAKQLVRFRLMPGVVSCLDFFSANGTAYLVMEYVDGLPLSDLLRLRETAGHPFNEYDLLGITVPLLRGLASVHAAGVLHRDIKPSNILVRRDSEYPVLIDFGAAKQDAALHTKSSMAPLSEGYAAIEQVGDGKLSTRTDIYAVGALMWRMVAGGAPPWSPPHPAKVEKRVNALFRGKPDPMPTAKELGAGRFPGHLLRAIDACLEVRDTERPANCAELLQRLEPETARVPICASAPLPQPVAASRVPSDASSQPVLFHQAVPAIETPRRKARWPMLAAVAAVLLGVLMGSAVLSREDAPPHQQAATAAFAVAGEPAEATVALLNSPRLYRRGMPLRPGDYLVEVSSPGFQTARQWLQHTAAVSLHRVKLERDPPLQPETAARTEPQLRAESSDPELSAPVPTETRGHQEPQSSPTSVEPAQPGLPSTSPAEDEPLSPSQDPQPAPTAETAAKQPPPASADVAETSAASRETPASRPDPVLEAIQQVLDDAKANDNDPETEPVEDLRGAPGLPQQAAIPAASAVPEPPPTTRQVWLPTGTKIRLRLVDAISTRTHQAGEQFEATLNRPLVVDGALIAHKDATVWGRIVSSVRSGRARGRAMLSLELVGIETADDKVLEVATLPWTRKGKSSAKKDVAAVLATGGIGAILGALIGGEDGASLGAAIGAGAAGTHRLSKRGPPVELKSETRLSFELSSSVSKDVPVD